MNNKQIGLNDVNEINPHMPQYIVKAPWYLNQTENSLNHQKAFNTTSKVPISEYTVKGLSNNIVYKYRKGACENCGSMTHKTKECCERPRKRGAKYTNGQFRPDEYIREVNLDYEGKRDRWNGYQPEMGKRQIQEYIQLEEEKKKILNEKLKNAKTDKEKKKLERDEDLEEDISSDEENDIPDIFKKVVQQMKTEEQMNSSTVEVYDNTDIDDENILNYFVNYKSKNNNQLPNDINIIPKKILYQLSTSKSLHIGEDYSKYLLNLALNSAYYDAKSRSMRENPLATTEIITFKGENSLRQTGDALKLIEMENFVNEVNSKNKELNLNNIAMPSQAELFYKYSKVNNSKLKTEKLKKAIDKYGGEEHFNVPDSIVTSSKYSEIDNSVIDQKNKQRIRSKYEEDVHYANHTSVWGSFYHDTLGWGYQCCCSFIKDSYCGGEYSKKENMAKIKEIDNKPKSLMQPVISEEEAKKKQIKKEQLNKINEKEAQNGMFNNIFDTMEVFESTGKYLGKKSERDQNN